MSSIPKCTSWLGHKFKARFTNKVPRDAFGHPSVLAMIEKSKDLTYECDICVRCGHVIKRVTP